MHIQSHKWQMDRRSFLRGLGVTLALPLLDAMAPSLALAAENGKALRRLVCIGTPFGMYPNGFFPQQTGADFAPSPLLEPLAAQRGKFTVFSHLDHGLRGGHRAVHTFLSGISVTDNKGYPEKNITLDQRAAESVGPATRFPALNTGVGGECMMSWTRSGVKVPPITSSRKLFRTLFVDDSPEAKKGLARSNAVHGSILDSVNEQAQALSRKLGARDKEKLDEYLTAVRDVEQQLGMAEKWRNEPKPKVAMQEPIDGDFVEALPVFYDLVFLALQTDSTRVATIELPHGFNTSQIGLKSSYHALSHHGKVEENINGLMIIEKFFVTELSRFIGKLNATADPSGGGTMLDSTSVLFGSGMGNGSIHTNNDLPLIVAGGGFKHAGHLSYPTAAGKRVPLCNLYLTLLNRFGMEIDKFNVSTGTLSNFA